MKAEKLNFGTLIKYNNIDYQIYSIFPIFNENENISNYYIQLANIKDINKSINIELNEFEIEKQIEIIKL